MSELVAVPVADLQSLIEKAQRRWMSVDTAARYADLSPESIRRMISSGDIDAHRPRPGKLLVDRRQLDSVIASK